MSNTQRTVFAVLLGGMTALPYAVGAVSAAVLAGPIGAHGPGALLDVGTYSSGPAFWGAVGVAVAMVWMIGVLPLYLLDVRTSESVPDGMRLVWAMAVVMLPPLMAPLYWVLHIAAPVPQPTVLPPAPGRALPRRASGWTEVDGAWGRDPTLQPAEPRQEGPQPSVDAPITEDRPRIG